jgi:hypothetical protein
LGSPKADESYWIVTSIGYGQPTKVNKFDFFIYEKTILRRKFT